MRTARARGLRVHWFRRVLQRIERLFLGTCTYQVVDLLNDGTFSVSFESVADTWELRHAAADRDIRGSAFDVAPFGLPISEDRLRSNVEYLRELSEAFDETPYEPIV